MARYNEILVGRFARSIQKLFGVKGEVPVASLAGEIVVSHSLATGRENRYLEDWKTFGARNATNAVAAQDSVIMLRNPTGSNTIAVVESVIVVNENAAALDTILEWAVAPNANLGATVTPACFDSRFNPAGTGNNGSQLFCSQANNVGQGNHVTFLETFLAATTMSNEFVNYDQQEMVMLPGSDLQLRTTTLNVALVANFRWRERFLEEPERS